MEILGKGGSIKKINDKYIYPLLSGKSFKDENFPVASFIINKKLRAFIRHFYFFARTSDDIADHEKLGPKEKLRILSYFDKCLKEKKKTDISVLNKLIITFSCHKFAQVYSRQLLVAFTLDAKKKRYKNWAELINYCKYSANPVGRFFIDLAYHEKKKKLIIEILFLKDLIIFAPHCKLLIISRTVKKIIYISTEFICQCPISISIQ